MLEDRFYERAQISPIEWAERAEKQVRAAGSREPKAAEVARETFKNNAKLNKIKVFFIPAQTP